MRRNIVLALSALVLSTSMAAYAAAATIVIDNFGDSPGTKQSVDTNAIDSDIYDASIVNADIYGTYRGALVQRVSGPTFASASMIYVDDVLSINNDSGVAGQFLVKWDGTNVASNTYDPVDPTSNLQFGLNLDLTGKDIALSITDTDLSNVSLKLWLFNSDSVYSMVEKSVNTVSTLTFFGSDFAGIDLENISAIALQISGPKGFDITIGSVVAVDSTPSIEVPEPASAALLGMSMVACFAIRRRFVARQRVAA